MTRIEVSYHNLGAPTYQCRGCNATMWYEERNNKGNKAANPTFLLCCQQGKVLLPRFNETPKPLNRLRDYSQSATSRFRDQIRIYNDMFCFTSFGAWIDHLINVGKGLYTFHINGQNYYRIGEEYERELFKIGEVGVVLVAGGEGEDDIENLKRSEGFRSEDVIEMKKNNERMAEPKESRVKVAEKEKTKKFHGSPDDGPANLRRDCMMVVREIVSRLLKEVEKLEWWFKQDIDDEEEDDEEESEGGSEVCEFDDLNNGKGGIT
ncbi:hypothetical protein Tco_1257644 [Tanacetum coccineum]